MLQVLYEDSNLVAICKPEGICSIPAQTFPNALALLQEQLKMELMPVHRLDKEVSGVLLYAKQAEAHRIMNQLFSTRLVHKEYLALVHGYIEHPQGAIDFPLREFGSGRVACDYQRGKPSQTQYQVEEQFPKFALVRFLPKTGRRHQLRVHAFAWGHAIVGDPLYGDPLLQKQFTRLMLHARMISFTYPATAQELRIVAAPTRSFTDCLNRLRLN